MLVQRHNLDFGSGGGRVARSEVLRRACRTLIAHTPFASCSGRATRNWNCDTALAVRCRPLGRRVRWAMPLTTERPVEKIYGSAEQLDPLPLWLSHPPVRGPTSDTFLGRNISLARRNAADGGCR